MGQPKFQTQYTGVRYYEHPTRKLQSGGADRYFSIRYKIGGKTKEEGIGWASGGWNAQKANAVRSRLKEAQTTGDGPKTLEAMREDNETAIAFSFQAVNIIANSYQTGQRELIFDR